VSTERETQPHLRPGRTGRDRRHLFPGRPRAANSRFSDDEYTELATAAELAGLTPTGFCAQVALDAARNLHSSTVERMEHEALGNLQSELFQARITLNQLRAELARHLDTDNQDTPDLDETIVNTARSLAGLDAIISRIHRRLAQS
jgi:uncharacterized protein (DUF1778 family)